MALGMRNADFEHEQLVEKESKPSHILRANAERTPSLWKSDNVREMDVLKWLEELDDLHLDGVDLVAGGPPCQPFSISGVHAGHNDKRNMFPAAIETVRRLRPKLFVFENVPGLLRPNFLPYYNYIFDQLSNPDIMPRTDESWQTHWSRVRQGDRNGLAYRVYRSKINAADLGVPQVRERVFLVGIRTDVANFDSWPGIAASHSRDQLLRAQWLTGEYWEEHEILERPDIPPRLAARVRTLRQQEFDTADQFRWKTTRDGLCGLPEPIDNVDHEEFVNHRGIPGARTYKRHTGGLIDWPAKTLKAGVHGVCGGEAMIRFHDESVRYLTVREAARIQSFPDNYEFPATRTAAMRAIGNAVAVSVAERIGRSLLEHTGLLEAE
ncbi:site-specific DNA methylase [Frankia sp. CcI6]|nr:site-specific DNA methylase [Frankia sp. CcI6]OAA22603.1 DNA (cytosine-5)-methyltransferase 1 [Frankia casuarinae]